jgi:DNA-binding MarR family transcriptional regulator
MIIQRNQAQPQNSLAELTGRDKTTFTRNIRTLERKKLVQRDCSLSDRRNKLVSITPLGEKYLELARPILKGIIGETEQDISHEEREKFLETLNKIKSKLCQLKK